MTQPPDPEAALRWQAEFDREQALADLDESIGVRQQVIADQDQSRLDLKQESLEGERAGLPKNSFAARVALEHRQSEVDRSQDRRDTRQKQLDDEQTGRDDVQDFLDDQQTDLDAGVITGPIDAVLAARRRQASAISRADAAVSRAETARRRADAAVRRAEATRRRLEDGQDTTPG